MKSRVRRKLGGGEVHVQKYTSSDGTKVKRRTVTKEVPSASGTSIVKKETKKQKFASGQTRKEKKISVQRDASGVGKITSVKERTSKPGILGKLKGLVGKSEKYGYSERGQSTKAMSYDSAKGMQKSIKKGRNFTNSSPVKTTPNKTYDLPRLTLPTSDKKRK